MTNYTQDPLKGKVSLNPPNSDNEKAPTYSGLISLPPQLVSVIANTPRDQSGNVKLRVAVWERTKRETGDKFMSGNVEILKPRDEDEDEF